MQAKKFMVISLAASLLALQCAGGSGGNGSRGGYGGNGKDTTFKGDVSALSSMEMVQKMGAGWNLGNTLDSHDATQKTPAQQETMWGNPKTTTAMIDTVKAAGFNVVRVPVTWYMQTGAAPDYTINTAWMDRVQEIVDYVIDNGMFCILNTHHDDLHAGSKKGYIDLSAANKDAIKAQFGKTWEQIAARFKDYDELLIFEGLNEPDMHSNSEWTAAKSEFLNELLQIFIDKVRAGGGKNAGRHLMVTPYCAAINLWANKPGEINAFFDSGAKKLKVNDPQNKLIVSLHYYEPYGFCMNDNKNDQWYRETYDTSNGHISGNRDAVINQIKTFTNNGIPVIMGETGTGKSRAEAERVKWADDYVKQVRALGVPLVIWDDGGSFQLLNRSSRSWVYPAYMNAFVTAAKAP